MKRTLVVILLCLTFSGSVSAEEVAVVVKCKGTVQVKVQDAREWHTAAKGEMLASGTSVITGGDGFAVIKFLDDKSFVKVLPLSGLKIDAKGKGKKLSKELYLKIGSIFSNVKKGGRIKFQIETSTSLATVKGTQFFVIVDKHGFTRVVCLEGLLELMNKKLNKAVTISKNKTGISSEDKLDVRDTRQDDLQIGAETGTKRGARDPKKTRKAPVPNERVLNVKFKNTQGEEKELEIILQKKK